MFTKEFLEDEYINKKKSWIQIAKENNTYPNKLRRLAAEYKIPSRSLSEAQKIVLTQIEHPTKGKKHSQKTKDMMSKSLKEFWDFIPAEDKIIRAEKCKEVFAERTDRQSFWEKGGDAVRKTAEEGSKMEKYIVSHLRNQGENVIFHGAAETNADLEVDILLPDKGVAIEIDGPSHFLPIWGEQNLIMTQLKDKEKNGLLLNSYRVLRLRYEKWSRARAVKMIRVIDEFVKSKQKFSIREIK